MDLSIILSIVAIAVSVIMSSITLLLTEYRGPNIKLVSTPKFEVDYEGMNSKRKEQSAQGGGLFYVHPGLDLKTAPFVFANYGGKTGTILAVKIEFSPSEEFKKYFKVFDTKLSFSLQESGLPTLCVPITIEPGDNKVFVVSANILSLDWKRAALAEVLDPAIKVNDIIERATERSRKNYESFCNFLSKSNKVGTITCTWNFTKGRFRTKVVTERLFADVPVTNQVDSAHFFLKELLQVWDDSNPTRIGLLTEITWGLEAIIKELKENRLILSSEVSNQNIYSSAELKTDHWRQLCSKSDLYYKSTNWFIIRSEGSLETELKELYGEIAQYNNRIRDIQSRDEFRTVANFETLNRERSKLELKVQEVENELLEVHRRRIQ